MTLDQKDGRELQKRLEEELRGLPFEGPPAELYARVVETLEVVPLPTIPLHLRLKVLLQRPSVTWGFRLVTALILLGIFLSLRELVALRRVRPLSPSPSGRTSVSLSTQPATPGVTFMLVAPQASSVSVVGTFNDWDPGKNPMTRDSQGRWSVRLPLSPGRYEYQFLVDGKFLTDPNALEKDRDGFGHENAVLRL